MKSVLMFEYFATGEGLRTVIRFTNDSTITDEIAVEKLKSEYNEHYHVGFELHDINEVKNNENIMSTIQIHVPILKEFIERGVNDRTPLISIKYDNYINYS